MLSRTRDGKNENTPRELIHFLSSLREQQMRRFEVGEPDPDCESLFDRPTFKDALPEVSKVRLMQTIYAEHPEFKSNIEELRDGKTHHTLNTLAEVWNVIEDDAANRAHQLVDIGFFEKRGTSASPEFWVPFLYRDALNLSQGSAE
jgi:hypothetical protein